jgi:hypothetical protein
VDKNKKQSPIIPWLINLAGPPGVPGIIKINKYKNEYCSMLTL